MLNPEWRYAKTDKGRLEVATRGSGLPQRLRSVLILIDGKSALRALLDRYASIPALAVDIEALLEQGYIAPVEPAAGAESAAVSAPDAPAAAAGAKERLIELAERLLAEHAGPVVGRLERSAQQPDELLAAIESCHKLIKLTIDEEKAERFRELGRRVLGAAG